MQNHGALQVCTRDWQTSSVNAITLVGLRVSAAAAHLGHHLTEATTNRVGMNGRDVLDNILLRITEKGISHPVMCHTYFPSFDFFFFSPAIKEHENHS